MLEEGKGLSRNTDLAQAFYSRAAELVSKALQLT